MSTLVEGLTPFRLFASEENSFSSPESSSVSRGLGGLHRPFRKHIKRKLRTENVQNHSGSARFTMTMRLLEPRPNRVYQCLEQIAHKLFWTNLCRHCTPKERDELLAPRLRSTHYLFIVFFFFVNLFLLFPFCVLSTIATSKLSKIEYVALAHNISF